MFVCYFGLIIIGTAVTVAINYVLRRRTISSEGKAVLITGCDRGFGFMLARHLSKEGYRVFAGCLDVKGDGALQLRKTSSNIIVVQCDVTNDQQVAEARKYVDSQLNGDGLWAVVNNAGVAVFAEAELCSMAQYQAIMNINWLGTVRVTRAFLPLLRAARGRVINMSSLAGRVGLPGFTAYSSSKFAVIGFSDCLRREMIKFGVKVITIEPSLYRTPICDRGNLTGQASQMWTQTSPEVQSQYGEAYFRAFLAKLILLLRLASKNTHEVVDDLVHAVTSQHPYTRYVPALWRCQIPSDCFAACPNLVQDCAINSRLKVGVLPSSVSGQGSGKELPSQGVNDYDDE